MMISAQQAGDRLGISKRRVLQLIKLKRLKATKVGNQYTIHEEDLKHILKRNESRVLTYVEVMEKLNDLHGMSDIVKKHLVCSMVGHSKLVVADRKAYYCARCGTAMFDVLLDAEKVAHLVQIRDGKLTASNLQGCKWQDTLMVDFELD